MLRINHVTKVYDTNGLRQEALRGVSVNFRDHEFAAILGQSGSGKTTLLNIIGGLDKYTDGDVIINGISTKDYKDKDWDTYRNHRIGFIFQSYNLIPHQTILANVELALTLSGVSKKARRQKATDALVRVGLGDHIMKKPNQLSGGQMQRVAIARALINDPDIILADEPTGALDSDTAIQVMDIIKEISKEKLIIMVTHNPEIAREYATRIIELKDGMVIGDSNPYNEDQAADKKPAKSKKHTRMKFGTALGLSLKNLLSKKGRTVLTSFAGSIGIIGIAAILALSNGVQSYIDRVEEESLSTFPLTIEKATFDMTDVMLSMMTDDASDMTYVDKGTLCTRPIVADILGTVSSQLKTNNLEELKKFIEKNGKDINTYLNGVQYSYDLDLHIYRENDSKDGYIQTNPNNIVSSVGFQDFAGSPNQFMGAEMLASSSIWAELLENQELLDSQYDVVHGRWPKAYNEVVLIVDKTNRINDYALYSLGLKNQDEITEMFEAIQKGETLPKGEAQELSYDDIVGQKFKIVLQPDYYTKEGGVWLDKSTDKSYIRDLLKQSEEISIVGIIRPNEETTTTAIAGSIAYLPSLEKHVIDAINASDIVKEQKNNPKINVFTGFEFTKGQVEFDINSLTPEQQEYIATLTPEQLALLMETYVNNSGASYEKNILQLGVVDIDSPSAIHLYAKDFDSKDAVKRVIEEYNKDMEASGKAENAITYTDAIGVMIESVSVIVDVVSYVLIAFVSISLIVSSIMIGIITYISVLERTKEIGILRAIGASKKDISRVFNAETFIVGLSAGCIGIIVTNLLCIPANMILEGLLDVKNIASLPATPAIVLIVISVLLTMFAGLVPSKMAARKDPVTALRTE